MRPLRIILVGLTAAFAWRVFGGRARAALQRVSAMRNARPFHLASSVGPDEHVAHGSHPSAAAAANHDFWDDRDVAVGEKLSAVGMKPGAR